MDGAQSNRSLVNIHFENRQTAEKDQYKAFNIYNPQTPVILMQDFSHVVKKIRNSLMKSGFGKNIRRLQRSDKFILWSHFHSAYMWDRTHKAFSIHHKLIKKPLLLNPASKIRNHLAYYPTSNFCPVQQNPIWLQAK